GAVAVEMPTRRSRISALDVITYSDGEVRLDLRVSSGTYVRAVADALGGHCRTLRRLEIGPFSVDEADPERFIPPDEALVRLGSSPERSRNLSRGRGRLRSGVSTAFIVVIDARWTRHAPQVPRRRS